MSSDLLNTGMPTASTLVTGRFHEGQHHVQIVNHQVEHHADVRAARRVGRKAVRLDEARVGGHAFQVFEDGVEPLDVADLQDAMLLLRQLDQFARPGRRYRSSAFPPARACPAGAAILASSKWVVVGVTMLTASLAAAASATEPKARTRYFSANLARGFGRDIIHPDKLHLARRRQLGINPHVLFAQRAGAEHGDPGPVRPQCSVVSSHFPPLCHCAVTSDNCQLNRHEQPQHSQCREAFGVRSACCRSRGASDVRKRQQADRTPDASRPRRPYSHSRFIVATSTLLPTGTLDF